MWYGDNRLSAFVSDGTGHNDYDNNAILDDYMMLNVAAV